MAAAAASERGKDILIIDRNMRPGRKLLITGKGRCNVTNNCTRDEFMKNVTHNGKFLYSSYSSFTSEDCMEFFEACGVPLKTERGNRVFPASDRSEDILSAFERIIKDRKIRVKRGRVTEITAENGAVTGVRCGGEAIAARSVILATGGKSYPRTGSDGDGYALASALGHTVTEIKPSLVPIVTEEKICADMMGLSLKNVTLTVKDTKKGKNIFSELGEMLFTHFGVSGPIVLSASCHMDGTESGRYKLLIDLKPALDEKKLDDRIQRDFSENPNRDLINSFGKLLPSKMIPVLVRLSGIAPDRKVNSISRAERHSLVCLLKAFPLTFRGFRPIDEAIITSGGIRVSEIDPKTMQSRIVNGLYFAGEIIDVDAYTGGFNLQIAFCTGHAAGMSV